MDYAFNPIVTVYRGRQYRSRLEARWAAFFDLLGWRYEYEPFDLNGGIPDFVLVDGPIPVEVKPITGVDRSIVNKIGSALPAPHDIRAESEEALLVGCYLPEKQGRPCVGWLISKYLITDNEGHVVDCSTGWELAPFAWYHERPDFHDFCGADGSYAGRLTGEYDGGSWGMAPRTSRRDRKGVAARRKCRAVAGAEGDLNHAARICRRRRQPPRLVNAGGGRRNGCGYGRTLRRLFALPPLWLPLHWRG